MIRFLIFYSFLLFLIACNNNISNDSSSTQNIAVNTSEFLKKIKHHPKDPFIETIKKSDFFQLSGLEEHIIETANGTVLSIPKGAFLDKDGNIIEKEISIEITEINTIEEQISSNISEDYKGKFLQNGATLFINATKDGQQLVLNENSPIYIETSLNREDNDLLIFEGIRNNKGEMQWISPKKPKQYLVPVNLTELDFLPENFALEVEKRMPYRNHRTANKKLIDSLYYSFSARTIITGDIYDTASVVTVYQQGYGDHGSDSSNGCTAISPASIKVIKGEQFSKTFIATKAFEQRMQLLHKASEQKALEIYTQNLTFDLSVCDSLVAQLLTPNHPMHLQFLAFAHQNLGNIKNLPASVKKLGLYYTKKLKSTRKELTRLRNDYEEALDKKSLHAQKKKKEYQTILHKRLKYRVDKFGFKLDKLGWVSLAKVLEPIEKF
jgi:hypothetical protein